MKQRHGRPSKVEGKTNKYNSLSAKDTRSLVAEYSTMTNRDLRKKYNISETQFRVIVQQYKLKTKYVGKFTSKARPIEFFDGKCGVYGIVRNNSDKVYIGSSSNISERLKNHCGLLNFGNHYNKSLQEDWGKFKFYFSLICECNEADLLKTENEILIQLDRWAIYNTGITVDKETDYKSLWEKIYPKLEILPNDCWVFTGKVHKGYGKIEVKDIVYAVHRIAYMAHNPDFSYSVSQTCKNKLCCNPKHLISISSKESSRLSVRSKNKRTCKRRSKLDQYVDMIMQKRNDGETYAKIVESLPIKISSSVLCRYIKNVEARGGHLDLGGVDI